MLELEYGLHANFWLPDRVKLSARVLISQGERL